MYSVSIQGKNIQILVTDFMVNGAREKRLFIEKRGILMNSESIIGWQFGCISGWVNIRKYVMGSILGPLGSVWGILSVHLFMLVLLSKKMNFCIFLGVQKEKNSISSTNFNTKF